MILGPDSWTRWTRRPWTPRHLGAVLTLAPHTLGSGTLTTWADAYGGATNVTQGTVGSRPTITQDARGPGRHGVLFDGNDDYLQGTFTLNQPCTIGLLYKSIVVGNLVTHDIIIDGGTTLAALVSAADVANAIVNFAVSADVAAAAPVADGVYERWIIVANGASSVVYRNGASVFSGQIGTNNPGGVTLAALRNGTRHTNIEVGAYTAIPSALNAANVGILDTWLALQ